MYATDAMPASAVKKDDENGDNNHAQGVSILRREVERLNRYLVKTRKGKMQDIAASFELIGRDCAVGEKNGNVRARARWRCNGSPVGRGL